MVAPLPPCCQRSPRVPSPSRTFVTRLPAASLPAINGTRHRRHPRPRLAANPKDFDLKCLPAKTSIVFPPPIRAMWAQPPYAKNDVEAGGARPLYPMMLEPPELRWAFIRKIYSILAVQMLLTVAVAAVVVYVRPVSHFFVSSGAGIGLYVFLIILPFIVMCPLYYYYQHFPVNFLLLGIFTVSLSFAVGLTCAFTSGKVILESVILTALVVVSLTLYTFWAASRGHDFNFLGPFLFSAVIILFLFALIQAFFPMGRISAIIYGVLASIVFSGYIIYDTDNLIKRYSYDDYIWAAVALYLDVINLFMSLLTLFRAADQ